jgi:hypothetical protein
MDSVSKRRRTASTATCFTHRNMQQLISQKRVGTMEFGNGAVIAAYEPSK